MAAPLRRGTGPRLLLDQYFYLTMALVIAGVLATGFSGTVSANLINPPAPRPWILSLHATAFTGWIVLFITQSALIRSRNIALHKRLGLAGIALGIAMPVIGVATAIAMTRFHLLHHDPGSDDIGFIAIPFNDVLLFSLLFGLAVAWRRWPEYHRRLMLCATIALTAAGFGRWPLAIMQTGWFYAFVDGLVVIAMLRDLLVIRRIHPAYLIALPVMAAGHAATLAIYMSKPAAWLAIVRTMIS